MSTNQPRKPAGTPAGGQWAPMAHDEADIELGAPGRTGNTATPEMADNDEVADRVRALLEVASATTRIVKQSEESLRARHPNLFDDGNHLWSGWEDGDRPRRLTLEEREQVRAWRSVASRYRHGDCGRPEHKANGCDIVCLSAHSKFEGDEGANKLLRKSPWEKSYHRQTNKEDNAVTGLMCRLVMHAVPKPGTAE
jgi:hypothetical protein